MTAAGRPSLLSLDRLRRLATGGAASVIVSVGAVNVLRIVSSMTLTRLLDAEAYGVVGIITSVAYVINMLADIGLISFIVRHQDGDDPAFLNAMWTLRLIRGFVLALVMVAIAPVIAGFTGKPALGPVIAVWGLSFVIEGFSALTNATAIRNRQLWRLSLMDICVQVVTLILSIGCAIALRNHWAMVIGMLGGSCAKMIASYVLFRDSGRRPVFDRARAGELWRFSRIIAVSSTLSILIMQSDKLVLARLMTLADFGLYSIAVTLMVAPVALVSGYVSRVLFPVYAQTFRETPERLRTIFYDARRRIVLLYMFGMGGLLGGGSLLVALLYDPRYAGVTVMLRWLAVSATLRFANDASSEALIATGRLRGPLIGNIARLVWLAAGGAIGFVTGDVLLLVAAVGTVEAAAMLAYWAYLRRAGLFNPREEAYGLAAAVAGAGTGFAVAKLALIVAPTL